jgi:hypothetical protein
MPYEISWEPLGVVFRGSGVILDEDSIAANEELHANPLLPVMKYVIIDYSLIEKFDLSSELTRMGADRDRIAAETNPDVKIAIITSSAFVRGMANMYAIYHEVKGGSWTTKIFECEEDARAWAVPSS